MDDVEDSSGESSVGEDLGEDEVGARRELGGLQNRDISGDDGLGAGALRKDERSVPGSSTCWPEARLELEPSGVKERSTRRRRFRRGSAVN